MSVEVQVEEDWFGRFDTGTKAEPVRRFTLTNHNQMTVQVITYGATVTSVRVPDKHGNIDDVVLGYDKFEEYYSNRFYFGCTVGRCANRIGLGRFSIDGRNYQLATNNGPNHLHGGIRGYDKELWESHVEGNAVIFSYLSTDGSEGYPGAVLNHVTYQLTADNELSIQYRATTNKTTPINLTNHSYFNLGGHANGDVLDHVININANSYLPVDQFCLATGEIAPVDGTPFDLRRPTRVGNAIQKMNGEGFDNNFCVSNSPQSSELQFISKVVHPESGRSMEVYSTQPGVQFYTGNFLPSDDSLNGRGGAKYKKHSGFCLETQNYPNAVNQSNFPNVLSKPGEVYCQSTRYKFGIA